MAQIRARTRARAATIRQGLWATAALASLILGATPARAEEYLLQRGDVLEFYVAGPLDIRESLPVNIDGAVVVPLAGVVPAAGQSLAGVSQAIRDRVSMIALPGAGDSGVGAIQRIHPSLVSVSLRGYRPVYVDGAVRRAGAHDFLPGLTARQAVALAGGTAPDIDGGDPTPRILELRGRLSDLDARAAAAEARVGRLEGELTADPPGAGAIEGPRVDAEEPERTTAALRRQGMATDLAYYDAAIATAGGELGALRRQLAAESAGAAADAAEFARLVEAQRAGTITTARLGEARRGLLYARSSEWDTQARLASVERATGELRNQRDQRALRDRTEAAEQLSAARVELNGLLAERDATRARIAYLSGFGASDPEADAAIRVTRADGARIDVAPGADAPLRPGDLVRVIPAAPPAMR